MPSCVTTAATNDDGELILSDRDFADFLAALESDEEPSEKLRQLFDRDQVSELRVEYHVE